MAAATTQKAALAHYKAMRVFYRGRFKDPASFTYDDAGNPIEKDKATGAVLRTVATLPTYRKPSMEEVDEMEAAHAQALATANEAYEQARVELYQATQEEMQKASIHDRDTTRLMTLNRKVKEANEALQLVRYPLRRVAKAEKIPTNQLIFETPKETRVYPYNIAVFVGRSFALQDQYVRIGQEAAPAPVTVAEARQKEMLESKQPVILFDGIEDKGMYGFLSLNWKVNVNFNHTVYHSAKQAVAAEMAKRMNDSANLERIMAAQTASEIHYTVDQVPQGDDPEGLAREWNSNMRQVLEEIQLAKFTQFPELGARLLETQLAILGASFPNDTFLGIGISMDRPRATLQSEWTGENVYGQVLMEVREQLVAQRDATATATTLTAATAATASTASSPTASAEPTDPNKIQHIIPRKRKPKPVAAQPVVAAQPAVNVVAAQPAVNVAEQPSMRRRPTNQGPI